MLNLQQLKIRVDASAEARMDFKYILLNDHTYAYLIEQIFSVVNTKILELNNATANRNKLIDFFISYFKNYLKIENSKELNLSKIAKENYSDIISLIDKDIIKWFIVDFVNDNVNQRLAVLDVINDTIDDIVRLKELLIVQYEEDKLAAPIA